MLDRVPLHGGYRQGSWGRCWGEFQDGMGFRGWNVDAGGNGIQIVGEQHERRTI